MSRALALQSFSAPYKTKPKFKYGETNTGKTLLAYALIALNVFLFASYLLSVNRSASTGYEIKSIQNKISNLSVENKKLNLRVSEQNSMAAVSDQLVNSQFVPVTSARFLQISQYSLK